MQYAMEAPPSHRGGGHRGRLITALWLEAVMGALLGVAGVATAATHRGDYTDIALGVVLMVAAIALGIGALTVGRSTPARDAVTPWGTTDVVLGLAGALVLFNAFAAITGLFLSLFVTLPTSATTTPTLPQALTATAEQVAASIGMVAGVAVMFRLRYHAPLRSLGLRMPESRLWFAAAPAVAIAGLVIDNLVLEPLNNRLVPFAQNTQCNLVSADFGSWVPLLVLAVCVLAPFAEETVFRGFVHIGLRQRLGPWAASALGGLIFALFHLQPTLILPLWLLGGLLALLLQRSGSVLPGMLAHGLFNVPGLIAILAAHGQC